MTAILQPQAPVQCDEFPFASTYEGSARWRYDGAQYRNWYSVQWVNTAQNLEAGRELAAWYRNQRILDKATETRNGYYMVTYISFESNGDWNIRGRFGHLALAPGI